MKSKTFIAIATGMALLVLAIALRADDRYRPVQDKTVIEECGACHMAFQPQMLPQQSWRIIMRDLDDHFGEDASLDQTTRAHITAYLTEHAANSKWYGGKFMRGASDMGSPLRITEMPYWVREHNEEVSVARWNSPEVKSRANCVACHPRAVNGDYDDD